MTEWLSWRWCLYINMALALPAAVGALFVVTAAPVLHRQRALRCRGRSDRSDIAQRAVAKRRDPFLRRHAGCSNSRSVRQ